MSTRAIIAITTLHGFDAGVYHHFDGYPTGLGSALIRAYHSNFKSVESMIRALIFDHPAGWSSIVNADWSLLPGAPPPDNTRKCTVCGAYQWQHYRQYYEAHGAQPVGDEVLQLGHGAKNERLTLDSRPKCYCHDVDGNLRTEIFSGFQACYWAQGRQQCLGRPSCDPVWMKWKYVLQPEGLEVWAARRILGNEGRRYAHVKVGTVGWDSVDAALQLQAIEDNEYEREEE